MSLSTYATLSVAQYPAFVLCYSILLDLLVAPIAGHLAEMAWGPQYEGR